MNNYNTSHENNASKKDDNSVAKVIDTNKLGLKGHWEVLVPIAILLVFIIIFAFLLPNLGLFSNKVNVNDTNNIYIRIGDQNSDVTTLQKNLCELEYLAFDDITGEFDDNTLTALNKFLSDNQKETADSCTLESFNFVNYIIAYNATTTVTTTTVPTTTTTAPVIKNIRITAASTKLRQQAREDSLPLFLLIGGATYQYIEQATDAQGNLWYKVVYSPYCNGWVNAKDAECLYQ